MTCLSSLRAGEAIHIAATQEAGLFRRFAPRNGAEANAAAPLCGF
jgi:hypothetical protein